MTDAALIDGWHDFTFSVRRPPGAVSFIVTHSERVSLVYFTCRPPQPLLMTGQLRHRRPALRMPGLQGLPHAASCSLHTLSICRCCTRCQNCVYVISLSLSGRHAVPTCASPTKD